MRKINEKKEMKTTLHFIGEIGVVNLQPQHLESTRNNL